MTKKDFIKEIQKEKENLILAIYEGEIIHITSKPEFQHLIQKK